jgi:hypothetical protein
MITAFLTALFEEVYKVIRVSKVGILERIRGWIFQMPTKLQLYAITPIRFQDNFASL